MKAPSAFGRQKEMNIQKFLITSPQMKRSVLILTLIAISILNLDAQYVFRDVSEGRRLSISPYRGVEGTPYFSEDFIPGDIYLHSGDVFSDALIRYNAYENEIEYMDRGRVYSLKNHLIREFRIAHKQGSLTDTVIFRKGFSGERLNPETFYIVHYEGDITLIESFSQRFQQELAPAYHKSSAVKKFVPSIRLFLIRKDSSVEEIYKSKNSVLNTLADVSFFRKFTDKKRRELSRLIRQEGLDMRKPDDIVRLLEYHDRNY